MKSVDTLKEGDVVIINSPIRLKKVHGKKGYISGFSENDDGELSAYSVDIGEECWFAFFSEIIPTDETVDPNQNMTDSWVRVGVDKDGKGDILDMSDDLKDVD